MGLLGLDEGYDGLFCCGCSWSRGDETARYIQGGAYKSAWGTVRSFFLTIFEADPPTSPPLGPARGDGARGRQCFHFRRLFSKSALSVSPVTPGGGGGMGGEGGRGGEGVPTFFFLLEEI